MKTLILTGRFGMGHVKAAEAIKERLLEIQPEAEIEIVDFISYMFPGLEQAIYQTFNFMVSKCSRLYNLLNQFASKNTTVPLKHTVSKKIERLITEFDAQQIIVTFPVCSQYISKYKQASGCQIPMYTFITDITAHEEWIAEGTDHYFVGDLSTKNTLRSKGVPEEKITISGIPVRRCFYVDEVRTVSHQKEILVMGGGLGLLPSVDKILQGLTQRDDVHVTIITGKNQKLQEELAAKYPKMEVIGFTDKVEDYMKRADVVVTKAGGITTFEAIAANTPIYVVKPFLEQEYGNAKYIEEHHIGRVLWENGKKGNEWKDFLNLIQHPTLLMEMRQNMMKLKAQFDEGGLVRCR